MFPVEWALLPVADKYNSRLTAKITGKPGNFRGLAGRAALSHLPATPMCLPSLGSREEKLPYIVAFRSAKVRFFRGEAVNKSKRVPKPGFWRQNHAHLKMGGS